jgi:mannose/fructose/sorbose-specific phosphotransferase system IIA component
MNAVIVISHGGLARGMVETSMMIVGDQERVFAVDLAAEEDPEVIAERVSSILVTLGSDEGCLILLDLFGGSPAQACLRLAAREARLELVSGVNLPMLLEVLLNKDRQALVDLAVLAEEKGKAGIANLRRMLAEQTDPGT